VEGKGTSMEYGLVIILIFQLCAPVCHQEMLSGAHFVVDVVVVFVWQKVKSELMFYKKL
jgi:hypothetical protein